MARAATRAGLEATLFADIPAVRQWEGVRLSPLREFRVSSVRAGERIVLSESVAARLAFQFARKSIPFHVDLYGFPPAELPSVYLRWSPSARRIDRIRRALRIQFATAHAERIYLSHPGQMAMLAGMISAGPQVNAPELLEGLSERIVYLPMGTPTFTPPGENPYPPALRERPVFLFGGGMWPWFDLRSLVEAFALANTRGSTAALFFLSGKDHTGIEANRRLVQSIRELASGLGATDRSVFFNERNVGPSDLPGYIGFCRAGAMANTDGLEPTQAWRTRYLDLLAAGRPLVLAGDDPLGSMMGRAHAALVTPSGNPQALADSVCRLAQDDALAARMGEASRELGASLAWERTLEPFRNLLASPTSFRETRRPGWHWLVRYALSPALARWD
jgi:glycosyltransferase involved in cell wall biosynthesis